MRKVDEDVLKWGLILLGVILLSVGLLWGGLLVKQNVERCEAIKENPGTSWTTLWASSRTTDDLIAGWPAVQAEWEERGVRKTEADLRTAIENGPYVVNADSTISQLFRKDINRNWGGLMAASILSGVALIPLLVMVIKAIKENGERIARNENTVFILHLVLVAVSVTCVLFSFYK